MTKTLVLGIGNTLLSDEGVGIHAVHFLQQQLDDSAAVTLLDGGTLSFSLASEFEQDRQLIVIDATELQREPGSVNLFLNEAMDDFLFHQRKRSVHEVGLMDLMAIARLTDTLPERRALIGIQPQTVGWGEQPSQAVQAAIPEACEQTMNLIRQWQ